MKKLIKSTLLLVVLSALCACGSQPVKPIPAPDKTVLKQNYKDYILHNYYAFSSSPCVGNSKFLVLPIWFNDSTAFIKESCKQNVLDDIRTAYFGSEEETGWNSVKTFYENQSFGKLTINGTVSDWYDTNQSYKYYGKSSRIDPIDPLIKQASDWYFEQNPEDSRKNYDCDEDGYLDAVILMYAAPNYINLGDYSYQNLWAYTSWRMTNPSKTNPTANAYFWCSYDFLYGNNVVEKRTGNNYAYGDTRYCALDTHAMIHETGHILGLDDYYDYSDSGYNYAGGFSMQDFNVGGHDPFSVMALGWADPYIPTGSCTIDIKEFQSSHDLILLTPEWNKFDSPFDEYILLELYTPNGLNKFDNMHQYSGGYPSGANDAGIRVWHVDARLYDFKKKTTTQDATSSSNLYTACSNTTNGANVRGYEKFTLLQLIRNNTNESKKTWSVLSDNDLFKAGSSFEFSKFSKQFVNSDKLDNGKSFPWKFKVEEIYTQDGVKTARITLSK